MIVSPFLGVQAGSKRVLSLTAFLLLLSACGPAPLPRRSFFRMTDPASLAATRMEFGTNWVPPPPATVNLDRSSTPIATVGNDSREVLAVPPYALVSSQPGFRVPADGRIKLSPPLPERLTGMEAVLLVPSLRLRGAWIELPPAVVRPAREHGMIRLTVELELPESSRGQEVTLNLAGYGLAWGRVTQFETPFVRIPEDATLEFAVGLLNPMRVEAPTKQQVQVCDREGCQDAYEGYLDPSKPTTDRWQRKTVDLAGYAGREIRLVFRSEYGEENEDSRPTAFPLWAHPVVYAPAPSAAKSQATNVILVSLDTLSAKHLDLYGYPVPTAPKMRRRFEEKGTVFDACVATATATAPSHMTMFTSLFPLEHGLTDGLAAAEPKATTAAEILQASGFATAAFTENGWLSVSHGFRKGFDEFFEDRSPDMMAPLGRVESTFGRGRAWLAANRDKAFFLFLHTYQVHGPYTPPPPYDSLFVDSRVSGDSRLPPRVLSERIAYDQEIRSLDDQLDLLLQDLDRLGLSDRTLLIVTSDHGEAFGEHGYVRHGSHPNEEVLHVPLVMQGPGIPAGKRVPTPVGHVDLLPTILEATGTASPHSGLRGLSLFHYFTETTLAPEHRNPRPLYSDSWGTFTLTTDGGSVPFLPPSFSVREGNRKMTRYPDGEGGFRYEAYDLEGDPGETNDLIRTNGAVFPDLRSLLDGYEDSAKRGIAALRSGEALPAGSPLVLPADQEEKLRALGYLQ
jgi:arylsulfatase A-like enzyme